MKRKKFIQLSSMAAMGSILMPEVACKNSKTSIYNKNWAGNITFNTSNIKTPTQVSDIITSVKSAPKIKVQGTTHCFNRIADSDQALLRMRQMNQMISINKEKMNVTVEAGMKYGDLAPILHQQGFALHNLASLPHISIAGSIATATHGSGMNNGNLASAVEEIELITANGDTVVLNRYKDVERFHGSVVALGALGVVSKVTLSIQPTFEMRQYVYENLPLADLFENFEDIMGAAYSVSLFTDWQNDSINEVWVKAVDANSGNFSIDKEFYKAIPAKKDMHPIASNDAINCTPQMGVLGPWYERLPHFKMGFTPSSGVELQAEYFIPFENGPDAIRAIQAMGKEIGPHLFISEIRAIAADDLWLSTAYKRKSIAIHFTWKQEVDEVMALLPKVEKALEPFQPRPHWGKLFTISKEELLSRYDKMNDFKKMAQSLDPTGKFINNFLQDHIF